MRRGPAAPPAEAVYCIHLPDVFYIVSLFPLLPGFPAAVVLKLLAILCRMRQSGDYRDDEPLTPDSLQHLLRQAVEDLDVAQTRREVAPFIVDQRALGVLNSQL